MLPRMGRMIMSNDARAAEGVRDVIDPRHSSRQKVTTWTEMRRAWRAYALLAPLFALLIVFRYYPPILGFVRSFYEWAPGRQAVFVGFENFRKYFAYPETPREIINMTKLLASGLVTGVAVPLIMAELIFSVRSAEAKDLYRLLLVIPMLAPGIVTNMLWRQIYDPRFGPLNPLLRSVGLQALERNWLGDPATALLAIVGVGFPWVSTVGTLIYLGGLGQITESVFDACIIDGCTGVRRAFLVDLPLLMGQVKLQLILSIVSGLGALERIMVLTDGGPGFVTYVPSLTELSISMGVYALGLLIVTILYKIAMSVRGYVGVNRIAE